MIMKEKLEEMVKKTTGRINDLKDIKERDVERIGKIGELFGMLDYAFALGVITTDEKLKLLEGVE